MKQRLEERITALKEEKEVLEKNMILIEQKRELNKIQLHQLTGHFNEANYFLEELEKEISTQDSKNTLPNVEENYA